MNKYREIIIEDEYIEVRKKIESFCKAQRNQEDYNGLKWLLSNNVQE